MARYEKILKIAGVLVVGGGIQVLLILMGTALHRDWPGTAAIEFTRDYFQKDPGISDRMCKTFLTEADVYAIVDQRQLALEEGQARGFGFSAMTSMIYHAKTETDYVSDSEATVRLTGKRRASIHPVYFLVAVLFDIGEKHGIDETVTVVKEGEQWKVCERLASVFQDT